MTREKAIKMLKAKLECLTRDVSGTDDDCNHNRCGECHLNYEQGTMGEQKEYLRMSIEALEQEPCEDAISRQIISDYVESHIQEINTGYGDLNKHTNEILRMIVDYIEKMESVIPKPKTGHWVEENINEWSRKVFCSECGCPPPFEYVNTGDVYSASGYGVINKTKYCPNCGAKMESEDKE